MQHLIIDSDDEFSIVTSELSAWDSDVHSIRTLASCANSWAEASGFTAPALLTLRMLLLLTMVRHLQQFWCTFGVPPCHTMHRQTAPVAAATLSGFAVQHRQHQDQDQDQSRHAFSMTNHSCYELVPAFVQVVLRLAAQEQGRGTTNPALLAITWHPAVRMVQVYAAQT